MVNYAFKPEDRPDDWSLDYSKRDHEIVDYHYYALPEAPDIRFKDPNHLGKESRLTKRYKQPKFIVTHRDPVKCVPSVTSTVMAMRRLHSDLDNSVAFGTGIAAACAAGMNDHMQWRDSNPDVPILDLGFREIVEDGLGTVKKVYAFLGMSLSDSAIKGVQAWESKNPKDKHGKASYSAESIGSTHAEILNAFASYVERFSAYL